MPTLDLPPPYSEIALPHGDAFAHAQAVAAQQGAGTLVWVGRADVIDCAVVLEPDQILAVAAQVLLAGMNAAGDSLAVFSPPDKPLGFVWPDAICFDGGLVGGARLAWPAGTAADAVPDWLVLGLTLRLTAPAAPPGEAPPVALLDEGFEDLDPPSFLAAFSRHLMLALDRWHSEGPASAAARWRLRGVLAEADLLALLATPTWRDAQTGAIHP